MPRGERLSVEIAARVRAIHDGMFGPGRRRAGRVPVTLALSVDVASGEIAGDPLDDQIARALREDAAGRDAYRAGAIHCYWCDGAACAHARPPRGTAVFTGYLPTGQPTYRDLAQLLLDRKDERVETLFSDRPGMVAIFSTGREAKGGLLHSFGRASKTYDLLGQVVAGYFRPGPGHAAIGHLAITIQAIESRHPDGRRRLSLNAVAGTGETSPEEILENTRDPWGRGFRKALDGARARLRTYEDALARDGARPSEVLGRVPGLLRDLVRSFDHAGRSAERRTLHAFDRAGDRPIDVALRDAREAADAAFLADEGRGTLIVLGPRGRAHAFTREGRHVTSLHVDGEALERRLARRRWRPAATDEIRAMRASLAMEAARGTGAPALQTADEGRGAAPRAAIGNR
ncbi:MAG: hypothetical protein U0166_15095 [Acidobacteriota bacterium]